MEDSDHLQPPCWTSSLAVKAQLFTRVSMAKETLLICPPSDNYGLLREGLNDGGEQHFYCTKGTTGEAEICAPPE